MLIVTTHDIEPDGWVCEGCGYEFTPGDTAIGIAIGITHDGVEIEGDYRCQTCWLNHTEVK